MRVNARLDVESQRQLEYLVEATGAGVSDVIKASLENYYLALRGGRAPKLARLLAFVDKVGSGRSDVSVRAKELFADASSAKTSGGRGGKARAVR